MTGLEWSIRLLLNQQQDRFESKYCERTGCAYPLTQQALEERKKQEESRLTEVVNERLKGKDKELQDLKEQLNAIRSEMNDVLEVLNIAKSKDGMLGKDRTMLDEKGRVTFGYVDNNNQIVEVNIPVDGVEIDRVAASSE